MVNLDRDLDEKLSAKFPGKGSDIINEVLRTHLEKDEKKAADLYEANTVAGRLAYAQAMEKLNLMPKTPWKSLNENDQLKFLSLYKGRLADLIARGF